MNRTLPALNSNCRPTHYNIKIIEMCLEQLSFKRNNEPLKHSVEIKLHGAHKILSKNNIS